MKVKFLPVKDCALVVAQFPNFHRSGSVIGMKRDFYGSHALLVRCGQWIYNVTSKPSIYFDKAK